MVQNCNREVDEVLRSVNTLRVTPCCIELNRVADCCRVLRPGGIFIYLTFGQPHFRRRYLDRPNTTLEIRKLGEAFHYYLYIVRTS